MSYEASVLLSKCFRRQVCYNARKRYRATTINISLLIHGAPYASAGAHTAYQFALAALREGHSIYSVFFYHEGSYNGAAARSVPRDEFDLPAAWRALIREHGINAVMCVAAAVRRGMLDVDEAARLDTTPTLAPEFTLAGLGELVEACEQADRVVTFGN